MTDFPTVVHRGRIERLAEGDEYQPVFRANCICGWAQEQLSPKHQAKLAHRAHIEELNEQAQAAGLPPVQVEEDENDE